MNCDKCKQTKENCECYIPDEEKHESLKEFTKKVLEERIKEKHQKCINSNGKFDYLKMSEMIHKKQW